MMQETSSLFSSMKVRFAQLGIAYYTANYFCSGQIGSNASAVAKSGGQQAPRPARAAVSEDEEKSGIPGDIEAIIKRADDLFDQGLHAQTREYLKVELPKHPPSVEMVRTSMNILSSLRDSI